MLNNIFERFVIDLWLPCLFGALFRDPAALFQQAGNLLSRVQVGDLGKLLSQSQFELVAPRRPLLLQLLRSLPIEGNPGGRDAVTDRGNTVLERERFRRLTVRLQKMP